MAPLYEARANLVWHRLGKTTHSMSDSIWEIVFERDYYTRWGYDGEGTVPVLEILEWMWLHCVRPRQTWSDTDLAKRRILCQIPSHVITTSRSPPLPSLENHLNFPEPNAPHRRSFYLFLFQTRVTEPLGLGGSSECMGKTFQAATTNTWELFEHRSLLQNIFLISAKLNFHRPLVCTVISVRLWSFKDGGS